MSEFRWGEWRQGIHEEVGRSSETFVKHFRDTYVEFPDLPIWAEVEVQSFGRFSKMISGLEKRPLRMVSQDLGVQGPVFRSWIHSLSYVRNLCAHHSRLWNRELAIKPKIPRKMSGWDFPMESGGRIFVIMKIFDHFFRQPLFQPLDVQAWKVKLGEVLTKKSIGDLDLHVGMGIPGGDQTVLQILPD